MSEVTDLRLKCYQDALNELDREDIHILITFQHIMLTGLMEMFELDGVGIMVKDGGKYEDFLERGRVVQDNVIYTAERLYKESVGGN